MKAVIISSGDGTRLRPITCSLAHCMLPIMGRPAIEHTVRHLARHNVRDIVIVPQYLSGEIERHFSSFPIEDVSIRFKESYSLADTLSEDTVFISDSIFCDVDFTEFFSIHTHCGGEATIIAKHTPDPSRYGCVTLDKDSFVSDYNDCPDYTKPYGISFSGIVAVKKGTKISDCRTVRNFLEKLTQKKNSVYCYITDRYIRDISDFESYHRVCRDYMDKKLKLSYPCEEKAPSVWIDKEATVMQGALITPPVYIGPGSIIYKGARIEGYSQILRDVTVDCHSSIKRSIVMDHTYISENATLRGSIIGRNCHIGYGSAAYEGSVIGFGSKIGRHCTLRTSAHIWPDKFIEDESCISGNIMWESTASTSLFQDGSISGLINREITPEFAVEFARAVVNTIGKKIAVSGDGDGFGSMIKNALIAGIQSGGGKAYDFGDQPLPITRSGVRFYNLDGGIAFSADRLSNSVSGTLDIISSSGITPSNEDILKLNQLLNDRISKKAPPEKIAEPAFMYEYKLYYLKQLVNSTSQKPLGANILIYSPSSWATELLKSAASDLECTFTFTDNSDEASFAEELTRKKYDLGAICDARCESLTLVTSSGYILSEFDYCALTSLVIMKMFEGTSVYVPESAPSSIEVLAKKHHCTVHRTPVSPPKLMKELSKEKHKPLLHQFIYRFDAVGAIIILLDFLYTNDYTLEALLSEIPPSATISSSVNCPKGDQASVLGQLWHSHNTSQTDDSDSIKINFQNGWVLVVPDRDRSLIKIISHASNKEYAREIADICLDELTQ